MQTLTETLMHVLYVHRGMIGVHLLESQIFHASLIHACIIIIIHPTYTNTLLSPGDLALHLACVQHLVRYWVSHQDPISYMYHTCIIHVSSGPHDIIHVHVSSGPHIIHVHVSYIYMYHTCTCIIGTP